MDVGPNGSVREGTITGNTIQATYSPATGIRFVDSENCNITGLLIEDAEAGQHTVDEAAPIVRDGLIELVRCRRVNISGTQVLNPTPQGIFLEDCSDTLITGCTVLDHRQPPRMQAAIFWTGEGEGNLIANSRIGAGSEGDIKCPPHVQVAGNRLS